MRPRKEKTTAFKKSLPVLFSYLFVGMAYGRMMSEAGFSWPAALLTSAAVYTGAFQFVLITFLSGGASALAGAFQKNFEEKYPDMPEHIRNAGPSADRQRTLAERKPS